MLGDAELADSEVPVEAAGLPEAQDVSAGWGQSMALLENGTLMTWGANEFGTVGNGTYDIQPTPGRVCAEGVTECPEGPYLEGVTAVSAGRLPSLALLSDGTVAAWGGDLYGDTGTDTARNPYPLPVCTVVESPCKPANYLREVVEIAAGADFSLARLRDGKVLAWGENTNGELGDGTNAGPETCGQEVGACSRVPVEVTGLSEVVAIAAGTESGLALERDGNVMTWGNGEFGQLGHGNDTNSDVPQPVCAVNGKKSKCAPYLSGVRSISGGYTNGYALLDNGTVVSWGTNIRGELGDSSPGGPEKCTFQKEKLPCSVVPVAVTGLTGVQTLAQGELNDGALVALEDGQLDTWGENEDGELGNGTSTYSEKPVAVCIPYAAEACPQGPWLKGQATAIASGSHDIVSLVSSDTPSITSLLPDHGPAQGGTRVTLIGLNLGEAGAVDFGSTPAGEVHVDSSTEVTAIAPPGSGTAEVSVTTPVGVSTPGAEDAYVYEGAPTAVTGAAGELTRQSATLNATVNPGGAAIETCRFEYGTEPSLGSSVACASLPGSGVKPVAVSATVNGLQAGTPYYFRVFAANAQGSATGSEQSFSTTQFPELGRCVKAGAHSGAYADSGCTKAQSGRTHEWEPWPVANPHFTMTGGPMVFEDSEKTLFECKASLAGGEYTGPQSATLTLTMTGCVFTPFQAKCSSPGYATGEIVLSGMPVQIGMVDEGAKPVLGWRLSFGEAPQDSGFECELGRLALAGSVIGRVSPADKESSTVKLEFKGKKGAQEPERFQGGGVDGVSLEGLGKPYPVSVGSSLSIADAEAVELRALP